MKLYAELFQEIPKEIIVENDENILFQVKKDRLFVSSAAGMLPVKIMDYMIVSGLCMLNDSNQHEETKKLKEILPDYEESKNWLEKNKQNLLL